MKFTCSQAALLRAVNTCIKAVSVYLHRKALDYEDNGTNESADRACYQEDSSEAAIFRRFITLYGYSLACDAGEW